MSHQQVFEQLCCLGDGSEAESCEDTYHVYGWSSVGIRRHCSMHGRSLSSQKSSQKLPYSITSQVPLHACLWLQEALIV